jgi:hypothetical protein
MWYLEETAAARVNKTENTTVGDSQRGPRDTPLYPLNLALASQTNGGRSVGIVRSRTQDTEFVLYAVRE